MPLPRRREKLIRDPVHDLISFDLGDPVEALMLRLIDTREFQRLRRIRQLGMAHMAFPGAEHSRFGHALGCAHLARRMLGELRRYGELDEQAAQACLCAALVHDVGHGPLSHILEGERFLGVSHEERTVEAILSEESGIRAELAGFDPALPERVAGLVSAEARWPAYRSILSGQLDADRLDYLLRDSLMTGVKYGIYDLERILKMLRLDADGKRLALSAQGLMPVEKYLQSRYHMYRQVYFHKAVTCAEVMLRAVLRRAAELALKGVLPGAEDADSGLGKLLLKPRRLKLREYLEWDDPALWSWLKAWSESDDPILKDISSRLLARRLFKSVDVSHIEDPLDDRLARGREAIEGAGLNPAYYFLRIDSSDTPYRPYDARGDGVEEPIYIEDASDGSLKDVEALSPTIRAFSHGAYTLTRIVIPAEANGRELRGEMERIFR